MAREEGLQLAIAHVRLFLYAALELLIFQAGERQRGLEELEAVWGAKNIRTLLFDDWMISGDGCALADEETGGIAYTRGDCGGWRGVMVCDTGRVDVAGRREALHARSGSLEQSRPSPLCQRC